jgi:hypothetical protein
MRSQLDRPRESARGRVGVAPYYAYLRIAAASYLSMARLTAARADDCCAQGARQQLMVACRALNMNKHEQPLCATSERREIVLDVFK